MRMEMNIRGENPPKGNLPSHYEEIPLTSVQTGEGWETFCLEFDGWFSIPWKTSGGTKEESEAKYKHILLVSLKGRETEENSREGKISIHLNHLIGKG